MSVVASGARPRGADDLWTQIARVAFRFLFVAAGAVAVGWALSNVRQVAADTRAVVLRFGAIARAQGPGLLIAWPRPIEDVVIIPALDRQIELTAEGANSLLATGVTPLFAEINRDPRNNAAFLLTGDSGIVRLQATLFYQITDAAAYVVAADHVKPALQRLFAASAVAVCAGRDLDAILVARTPGESDADRLPRAKQERFRLDLVAAVNHRLAALAFEGAGLGITVSRIDLTASLPGLAKLAFEQVLTTIQTAERDVASARADATKITQSANQERNLILVEAAALAAERRTEAATRTAGIAALNTQYAGSARGTLIRRIYYERIAALLKKAGRIDAFDPSAGAQLSLPGRGE
jgi:regulator of protease activity HflC (stomatin/prohibitin superfamily)